MEGKGMEVFIIHIYLWESSRTRILLFSICVICVIYASPERDSHEIDKKEYLSIPFFS